MTTMTELDQRLEAFGGGAAPDLWDDIRRRHAEFAPQSVRPVHRGVIIAFALGIAVLGLGFGYAAFRNVGSDRPIGPTPLPTGDWIAVVRSPAGGDPIPSSEVLLIDVASGAIRRLTDLGGPEMVVHSVAWSPSGDRLALVMGDPNQPLAFAGAWDLYTVNVDGSDLVRVTDGENLSDLQWLPDGREVAATSDQASSIVAVDVADGSIDAIAPPRFGPYLSFSVSAVGGMVVYQTAVDGDETEIAVLDPRGNGSSTVPFTLGFGSPAWSPDGSTIAVRIRAGGLGTLQLRGSTPVPLTTCRYPNCGNDLNPSWSPDGSRLAFIRQDGDGERLDLFTVASDGSGLHRLMGGPWVYSSPAWRPDLSVAPHTPRMDDPTSDEIQVGFGRSVATGGGSVWVAVDNDRSDGSGSLLRVNPNTMAIDDRIPVPGVPVRVEGGGALIVTDGAVWVGGTAWQGAGPGGRAVVTRVDLTTSQVVTIDVAVTPPTSGETQTVADLASIDGRVWAYVVEGDPQRSGSLVALDERTGAVIDRAVLQSDFNDARLVEAFGSLWVSTQERGDGVILRVDPTSGAVTGSFPWGAGGDPMTSTPQGLLVANGETEAYLGRIVEGASSVEILRKLSYTPFLAHDVPTGLTWYRDSTPEGFVIAYLRDHDLDGGAQTDVFPEDGPPIALAVSKWSTYLWIVTYDGRLVRITVT